MPAKFESPSGTPRILLADDSPNIHKAVTLGLRKENFEIIYCDNGQDALRILRDKKPHLALLDLDMPGPNGAELVQILRKDPETAHTKVVLLCSSFDQVDEAHLDSLPADGRIWKPFEAHVLLTLIKNILNSTDSSKQHPRTTGEQTLAVSLPPKPKLPRVSLNATSELSDDLLKNLTQETFKEIDLTSNGAQIETMTSEKTLAPTKPLNVLRENDENTWALASADVQLTPQKLESNELDIEATSLSSEATSIGGQTLEEPTGGGEADMLWSSSDSFSSENVPLINVPLMGLPEATMALDSLPHINVPAGLSENQVRKIVQEEVEKALATWFQQQLDKKLQSVIEEIERES